MTIETLATIALKAATESGEYLKTRKDVYTEKEEGRDIKLSSDKTSERIIVDILKETGIPILSEEAGNIGGAGDMLWITDPLDGTFNYLRQMDELCCVSIALWKDKKPLLGVINRFAPGEIYSGIVGNGAFLNGKRIKPSGITKVEKAVLATGFPVNMDYSDNSLREFSHNAGTFKKVRMLGSAALMCAFVAAGKTDAYFEDNIMLWDIAGALAIAKASGCAVDLKMSENNQCVIKCFANKQLMEDFYAKTV